MNIIKIKIKKGSEAHKIILEYMERKKEFREACKQGKGIEWFIQNQKESGPDGKAAHC